MTSLIDYTQLRQDLIQQLGLSRLTPQRQDELLGMMLEALLKRIFMETMDRLGDAGVNVYEKLIGSSNTSEEMVAKFLEARIPDYDAFVGAIVEQFKQDCVAIARSGGK